ncbi:MFS transporter [Philodulcilactobacillus myokoensis]|uniref:MFS transporter n=2 Tax=Philodulcilactobacillus myokoensis TaxID=2929573 RepID=A0A9W6B1V8_9LACO|nr:MFS transporter [Philodulcilactobacillus myokoensis]
MSTIDASIVTMAIPKISQSLNTPMNETEWITSVYLVLICMLLILFGKLADQIGRIPIFQYGTLVFIIGSLFSGISSNLWFLIISRGLQSIGAAMTMSTNMGIITEIFPPSQHGMALGLNGSIVQLGNVSGPAIGGLILSIASWHWIFLVNVPIGIIAFMFGHHIFPHHREKLNQINIDWPGFITFAGFILFFYLAIYIGQATSYVTPLVISFFVLALILIGSFIGIENHVKEPLIRLSIFKNANFTIAIITTMLIFMTVYFNNVIMPFYLQNNLMFSAGTTGLILMFIPLANIISAPIGGYLSDHIGSQKISMIALFIFIVPITIFNFITPKWSILILLAAFLIFGFANGNFQNNPMIMDNVGKEEQGIAGSLAALTRNIGFTTGLSLSTSLVYWGVSIKAHQHFTSYPYDHPDWFVYGMHFSYRFALGFIIINIILLGTLMLRKHAKN